MTRARVPALVALTTAFVVAAGQPVPVLAYLKLGVDLNGQTIHKPGNTWIIGGAMMLRIPRKGDFYLTLTPTPDLP